MIIVDCEQGSPEWHKARAGAITSSMFAEVRKRVGGLTDQQRIYVDAIRSGKSVDDAKELAGYKSKPNATAITKSLDGEKVGDYSEAAKDYAFRLAMERISGEPLADEQFETWAMRRGKELEPVARGLHSFQENLVIRQTGLVLTDDGKFGASADGLIGKDGGSEYKCFTDPAKLRRILITGDISDETDQVQGCLWLTGREWWHFCLFSPSLTVVNRALTVYRVFRDDDYIESLESDLIEFDKLVCEYQSQLQNPEQMKEAA